MLHVVATSETFRRLTLGLQRSLQALVITLILWLTSKRIAARWSRTGSRATAPEPLLEVVATPAQDRPDEERFGETTVPAPLPNRLDVHSEPIGDLLLGHEPWH